MLKGHREKPELGGMFSLLPSMSHYQSHEHQAAHWSKHHLRGYKCFSLSPPYTGHAYNQDQSLLYRNGRTVLARLAYRNSAGDTVLPKPRVTTCLTTYLPRSLHQSQRPQPNHQNNLLCIDFFCIDFFCIDFLCIENQGLQHGRPPRN